MFDLDYLCGEDPDGAYNPTTTDPSYWVLSVYLDFIGGPRT